MDIIIYAFKDIYIKLTYGGYIMSLEENSTTLYIYTYIYISGKM